MHLHEKMLEFLKDNNFYYWFLLDTFFCWTWTWTTQMFELPNAPSLKPRFSLYKSIDLLTDRRAAQIRLCKFGSDLIQIKLANVRPQSLRENVLSLDRCISVSRRSYDYFSFQMRPRISIRGSVRPSVRPSVTRFFQWADNGGKWSEMTGKTVL